MELIYKRRENPHTMSCTASRPTAASNQQLAASWQPAGHQPPSPSPVRRPTTAVTDIPGRPGPTPGGLCWGCIHMQVPPGS